MTSFLARILPITAVFAIAASLAQAKNVDLSTVPARQGVQLTIYNSEDLTLVRETRKVSFKPGANPLQFSWANTLIDPTSVQLRFVTHPDKLELLDTTFPHDKPQMLYWNVQSELDGEAMIEITYFTSGISWSADYVCTANPAETEMGFEGFVRVFNNSGEEYEDAQVRLIVGRINLVEKIAQLARVPMNEVGNLGPEKKKELRYEAARRLSRLPATRAKNGGWGFDGDKDGQEQLEEKQIIKEGLSEYFIYTIEGTETIRNGWSKRMRSFEGTTVPFKIQYRYRPAEYGDQLVRMYLLTNDKDSKLGTTPLPDGMVRVFRQNGQDGLSYLVGQSIKYIPIGDKIELNLGRDPNVIFELVKLRCRRDNIWMQLHGANIFKKVGEAKVQIEVNSSVVGWDDRALYSQRVRNYTAKPIDLEVRRTFPGHVIFRSELPAKNHDYQTVEYTAAVKPGEKADLLYEVIQHQGRNAKQKNVTVEKAAVAAPLQDGTMAVPMADLSEEGFSRLLERVGAMREVEAKIVLDPLGKEYVRVSVMWRKTENKVPTVNEVYRVNRFQRVQEMLQAAEKARADHQKFVAQALAAKKPAKGMSAEQLITAKGKHFKRIYANLVQRALLEVFVYNDESVQLYLGKVEDWWPADQNALRLLGLSSADWTKAPYEDEIKTEK